MYIRVDHHISEKLPSELVRRWYFVWLPKHSDDQYNTYPVYVHVDASWNWWHKVSSYAEQKQLAIKAAEARVDEWRASDA